MKVYAVRPQSKENLEYISESLLEEFDSECLDSPKPVKVERLIDNFLSKKYDWSLDIREDLPDDILGLSDPKSKTICVSEKSYQKMIEGDGRCRFTGCHEFSHVVLHRSQMKERMIELGPKHDNLYRTERKNLRPFEDPEWQADYLAGALLMPRKHVLKLMNSFSGPLLYEEMAKEFKVSYTAAEVRVRKMPK